TLEKPVNKRKLLETVPSRVPVREGGGANGGAPAVDYEFLDGAGEIGIIGSVTEPFCSSCTRLRLTADGKLVTCLFAESGFDLKGLLRSGITDEQLIASIANTWALRTDRYSDLRWEQMRAGTYQPSATKQNKTITLVGSE